MIKILYITLIIGLLFNQAVIGANVTYDYDLGKDGNIDMAKLIVIDGTSWIYTNNWNTSNTDFNFKGIKGSCTADVDNPGTYKLSITHVLKRPAKIESTTLSDEYITDNLNWEVANSGLKTKTGSSPISIETSGNSLTEIGYIMLDDASAFALLKDNEMAIFAKSDASGDLPRKVPKSINDSKNKADAISGTKTDLTLFMFKDYVEDNGDGETTYSLLQNGNVTYRIKSDSDSTNKATFGISSATNATQPDGNNMVKTENGNFGAIKLTIPANHNVGKVEVEATYERVSIKAGNGAKTVGELTVTVSEKASFGINLKLTILSFLLIALIF